MRITRLAPSPTGALHLGNARTFLVNWILARRMGWRVILRIEDLDGPRIKKGADAQAIDDLRWLGMDWDEDPVYQSTRVSRYREAIQKLVDGKEAYYCACSRSEVALAASAPHAEDGSSVYPGTCRGRFATAQDARRESGRDPAIRFRVPEGELEFRDEFAGRRVFDPKEEMGDFVIAKGDGTAAYQLAVVVDDTEMGITDIVRGDDLMDSTPRQILLYRALGMADRIPRHYHLPLVVGRDGRRLAKRHGDTRLASYREHGVSAQRVLALLARWCGIGALAERMTIRQVLEGFALERMPRERVVFDEEIDGWLRKGV